MASHDNGIRTEEPEQSEPQRVVTQNTTPITRGALWLNKKHKVPMWGIYFVGFLFVIISWVFLASVVPEGARPLVNVLGCGLLAVGGLFAAIAKTEPVYTGNHESNIHTKWRTRIEDFSYIAVVVGGLFVLVAAVKDPAAIASWYKLWHLW